MTDDGNPGAGADASVCESDRTLVGAVCLPVPPPRPLAPSSTGRVSSRQPALHWELGNDSDGAHVELCRDRACHDIITSFDATGSSGTPPAELPAGLVYWRSFGRQGTATGLDPSATWQFTVGARSAPVDTSWGISADFNGDGFADLAFQGRIYSGNASGVPSAPVVLVAPTSAHDYFAINTENAGDVNGDGYADLIVDGGTNPATGPHPAYVYLYLGGPTGLASYPAITLDVTNDIVNVDELAGVGDVNGDGYADVVISSFNSSRSRLYFGGPGGLSSDLSTSLNALDGTARTFNRSVLGAGDVNGDGFADILAINGVSEGYVYLGSATAPGGSSVTLTLSAPRPNVEFRAATSVDDMNGDGYADVLIGEDAYSHAYIYFGGAQGPATTPSVDLTSPDGESSLFGFGVSGLGDTNGDGFADTVVGTDQTGRVYVYLGSDATIGPLPSVTPASPNASPGGFGFPVRGAGDVNGDGFEDLLVGDDNQALPFLYRGSTSGLPSAVSATLPASP